MCAGQIRHRMRSSGGPLWTRWRIFELRIILRSSWLTKRLSAFHDNLLHGVNLTGSTDQVALCSWYFRPPPRCSRSLRSSQTLCGVGCWLVTEVSRQYKGLMLKSWTVRDCLTLDGVDTFLRFEDEVRLDQWYYQIKPAAKRSKHRGTSYRCWSVQNTCLVTATHDILHTQNLLHTDIIGQWCPLQCSR